MPLAIAILVLAAGWRVFTLYVPPLSNFSPVMALAFCAGAYYRRGWIWLAPVWGDPPFRHVHRPLLRGRLPLRVDGGRSGPEVPLLRGSPRPRGPRVTPAQLAKPLRGSARRVRPLLPRHEHGLVDGRRRIRA